MELRGGSTRHKDLRKAPKGGAPVLVENSEHACGTERETMLQVHGTAAELGRKGMTARGVATELVLIHSFIHPGPAGGSCTQEKDDRCGPSAHGTNILLGKITAR